MKRVLISGLLLSTFVFADCSQAERIFADSRDESNLKQKIALIKKAKMMCPTLAQIEIEMKRLKINYELEKNHFD